MTKKLGLGKTPSSTSIPSAVIKRLPVYYRFLNDLIAKEITRISSVKLAAKMGITASQLRQDLCWFGSFGHQGYGYRVADLLEEVKRILGLNHGHQLVLVGVGHLGRAIIDYSNFRRRGFEIGALFDRAPQVIGETVNGLIVQDITQLPDYLHANSVDIGVITAPTVNTQTIVEMLVVGGVKGIWSFTPFPVKVPDDVVVEYVHLEESLLVLSLKIQQN
jgi:redox-sensing transcriptional repressor